MNAIKTLSLSHVYPDGTKALSSVDFEARWGERVAVVGPNGSGKSTLFYHFNGILSPTSGKVLVEGEELKNSNLGSIRRKVGLVFQDPDNQLFAATVEQDIAFGPRNLGLSEKEVKERVEEALNLLDIADLRFKNPSNLSTGQKKLIAIAGVFAMHPEILVFDEPTSGLDSRGAQDTMEAIDELNSDGKTVILSTHDTELVANWAERIYVLSSGRVLGEGTPKEIFSNVELIRQGNLRLPTVIQTYREFKARGISNEDVPLSTLDLADALEILAVRYAIAHRDLRAGENMGVSLREGMLYTTSPESSNAAGRVLQDAQQGEEVVIASLEGSLHANLGKICVIKIPGVLEGGSKSVDLEGLKSFIQKNNFHRIAAMGTSAKVTARKLSLLCDFEIDVVQSAISAALRGLSVAVLASGGMADRAVQKVKENNLKNRRNIQAALFSFG